MQFPTTSHQAISVTFHMQTTSKTHYFQLALLYL